MLAIVAALALALCLADSTTTVTNVTELSSLTSTAYLPAKTTTTSTVTQETVTELAIVTTGSVTDWETHTVNPFTTYVLDPQPAWDPQSAAMQPTPYPEPPACKLSDKKRGNATLCHLQKRMFEYYKPIDITTVQPLAIEQTCKPQPGCDPRSTVNLQVATVTMATRLTTPHWGTKGDGGVYWPMSIMPVVDPMGSPSSKAVRLMPSALIGQRGVKPDPKCWDESTCCEHEMSKLKHPFFDPSWFIPVLATVGTSSVPPWKV